MTALSILFGILMFLTALFLILLVLVQRGRGGGLSGALGGMGGQSAFGTKAGDLFTRITIGAATFWILLCIAAILVLNRQSPAGSRPSGEGSYTVESREKPEKEEPDKNKPAKNATGNTGGVSAGPAEKGTGGDAGVTGGASALPAEQDDGTGAGSPPAGKGAGDGGAGSSSSSQ